MRKTKTPKISVLTGKGKAPSRSITKEIEKPSAK